LVGVEGQPQMMVEVVSTSYHPALQEVDVVTEAVCSTMFNDATIVVRDGDVNII
jgi:hypothetical protein